MQKLLPALALIPLVLACEGTAPDANDTCPLDAAREEMLALRVQTLLTDAVKVAEHAYVQEAAWSVSLAGSTARSEGYAFLVEPCTAPSTFDPYCEAGGSVSPGSTGSAGGLPENVSQCTRFECEDSGIYLTHIWYADSAHETEGDAHSIQYPTDVPVGTATHSPNPSMTWRAEVAGENSDVSAEVDASVTIAPADGSADIDASHSGTAIGTRRAFAGDTLLTSEIELSFPRLSSRGAIDVTAAVSAEGRVTGSITVAGEPLGAIDGDFDLEQDLPVAWESCP